MAILRYCLCVLVALAWAVPLTASAADGQSCHKEVRTMYVNGTLQTHLVMVCAPAGGTVPTATDEDDQDLPPTDSGLDPICVSTAISNGVDPFVFCDIPPNDPPPVTPGYVAAALARMPLPASTVEVQPPHGRTLVNFDTNFYTLTSPLDRTFRLLGQRVDLHIVPSQFGWRFGDGALAATDEPGSPYPELDVTHRYLRKGRVAPSVDTTYIATFRVNGGPWRDVPGSVTIPGAPVQLEVLTATPTLVGYGS